MCREYLVGRKIKELNKLLYLKKKSSMNLQGQKVKITVSEPWDWEDNIMGVVLSDREKNTLLVKLSNPIKGKEITSDLIELRIRHEKTSFESLSQHSDIAINGALIKDNNFDFIIIGSVILV